MLALGARTAAMASNLRRTASKSERVSSTIRGNVLPPAPDSVSRNTSMGLLVPLAVSLEITVCSSTWKQVRETGIRRAPGLCTHTKGPVEVLQLGTGDAGQLGHETSPNVVLAGLKHASHSRV